MKVFRAKSEILPAAQQAVWPYLNPVTQLGYVLYGGTAIALRLGHRQSVDFDFFTNNDIDKQEIFSRLVIPGSMTVLQDETNTLTLNVSPDEYDDYVKISFFGGLNIGRVGEPELTEDQVLQVASFEDLMAAKCKVLLQRIESKDYIDIAALIKAGVHLDAGLAAAECMYKPTFQPSEALKALVYYEGGDLSLLSDDNKQILIDAVSQVRDLPHIAMKNRLLPTSEQDADTIKSQTRSKPEQ